MQMQTGEKLLETRMTQYKWGGGSSKCEKLFTILSFTGNAKDVDVPSAWTLAGDFRSTCIYVSYHLIFGTNRSAGEPTMHLCHYPNCGKIYKKTSHLRAHLRWHIGDQPYLCSWPGCVRRFTRWPDFGCWVFWNLPYPQVGWTASALQNSYRGEKT